MARNLYEPQKAEIIWIEDQAPNMRMFGIRFKDKKIQEKFTFIPGQFVFISLFGHGEFAVSIASHYNQKDHFEILVRKAGAVTGALFGLNAGAKVGARGPFGNGFDIRKYYGKDIVIAAGGCGVGALRALMKDFALERKKFGKLYFMYGVKNPEEILFRKDLKNWQKMCKVLLTVDKPENNWLGNVGTVTSLFDQISLPKSAMAIACGPSIMFKYLLIELKSLGIQDQNIYLSLERRMKCGIGKCQHCTCGDKYACLDGPVFRYSEIKDNEETML